MLATRWGNGSESHHEQNGIAANLPTEIIAPGKSSSVVGAFENRAAVVFEGQLSRPEPGMEKIKQALQRGFDVVILAVHVAPELALQRTNSRYLNPNSGRGASIAGMADIQGNLPAALRQIQERFGQSVRLTVIDNTRPEQRQLYKGWGAIPVLGKEGNREYIRQRLAAALEAGFHEGRYSDGFYAQAAGREAPRTRRMGAAAGHEDD